MLRPIGRFASLLALVATGLTISTSQPASAACTLSVSGISPSVGFTTGGLTTTISGSCFTTGGSVTGVAFGGTAGTSLNVATDSSLTVKTPPATAGAVTVTVTFHPTTGPDQTATTSFTYVAPPNITSLLPTKGAEKGGTPVIVAGTGLHPVTGATAVVNFGATAAPTVSSVTDTSLTAVSPAHAPGNVSLTVVVTLPGGGGSATSNGLIYTFVPAPTVTSVSPASGPPTGGQDITITGTGFQPGANVFLGPFDGTAASCGTAGGQAPICSDSAVRQVSVLSATSILATTPPGINGATNIVVSNPDGQLGALKSGAAGHYSFTGSLPTITAVAPASGTSLGGAPFDVTGTGFGPGSTVTFKAGAEPTPPTVSVVTVSADGLHITGTTPPHPAGAVDIIVTNVGGGAVTKASGYTYTAAPAPTFGSITPATTGTSLGNTALTISGTNFAPGAKVSFGAVRAPLAAVLNSSSLNTSTPAHPAGGVVVTITNPDGQSVTSAANAYTFVAAAAPHITTVNPTSGDGGTQVTITGTGFANTNGTHTNSITPAIVSVGSATCIPTSQTASVTCLGQPSGTPAPPIVLSDTTITGTVPNAPGGAATVTVANPDGQSATSTFTYTGASGTPTLTGVSPATGPTLGHTSVTLTGTNFVKGAVVAFGGARAAPAATVVSGGGTTITVATPAGVYGVVDVTVTNPTITGAAGTHVTRTNGFTFTTSPQPTITSITPSTGPSGTQVTITGTGFASTNGANTNSTGPAAVTIGGQPLLQIGGSNPPPVVTSSTSITGIVPTRPGGAVDVAVTNPDGQGAISAGGYTYPSDSVPPTTTATGALAGGGTYTFGAWATRAVAVTLTAVDPGSGSGVKSVTSSSTGAKTFAANTIPGNTQSLNYSEQGISTLTFHATDNAGNVEADHTATIKVDTIAPTLNAAATVPGSGTYTSGTTTNQNVTVTFTCSDTGSGVDTLLATTASTHTNSGTNPLAVTITSTGTNQSVSATCADLAGNTTTVSFGGITISRTGPVISASATSGGQPYTAGTWTRQTVTVVFSCSPPSASNQIVSLTAPVQVDGPTTNQTVTGTCTDSVGNSASTTFGTPAAGIDIDRTVPLATATASTTDNNGQVVAYTAGAWANHDVVVTFQCTDSGANQSGVATLASPVTVSAEGTTSGVSGGCTDVAGNGANPPAFFGPILIDKTAPACSAIVSPTPIHPATTMLVNVTANVSVTDGLSGPNGFKLVSVTSNNPSTAGSDIVGFAPGTASTSGQLRATFGRLYTFTYQGFDVAGNASPLCTASVQVTRTG